jgi:hypothetical protein
LIVSGAGTAAQPQPPLQPMRNVATRQAMGLCLAMKDDPARLREP